MGANDAAEMLEVAKQECVRLERENRALREAVSLPDRETLVKAIASVSEHDPDTHDFISPEKAADAVLAALSTQPAAGEVETITDAEVKDERELVAAYDIAGRMPQGAMTAEQWSAFAGLYNAAGRLVERIESPEAARGSQPTELAELFPGTLAALDNLSIRPEGAA